MADNGLSEAYKVFLPYLFCFLSLLHIFRATSFFFFLLTGHTGAMEEAEMRWGEGNTGCHTLLLELKINNWGRVEERKWVGPGVERTGQHEKLEVRAQSSK